jgi:hypothetical protein
LPDSMSGACLWQVQGKEAADPLLAGHSAASRQERNSILIPSAAGLARGAIDQVVFSSRSEAPPSP